MNVLAELTNYVHESDFFVSKESVKWIKSSGAEAVV